MVTNRRTFLKSILGGAAALAVPGLLAKVPAPMPEPDKVAMQVRWPWGEAFDDTLPRGRCIPISQELLDDCAIDLQDFMRTDFRATLAWHEYAG